MRHVLSLGLGLLVGCALQDFSKISQGQFECPGLPEPFGQYQSPACFECLRDSCCKAVSDCQADSTCADGLAVPLTPVASLPDSPLLDGALACLQKNCDSECGISFGCEGTRYASDTGDEATFLLRNFGRTPALVQPVDVGLCGTAMDFCAVDPATAVPAHASGLVSIPLASGQAGTSFAIEDASYSAAEADPVANPNRYPPHNVTWSEALPTLGSPLPEFLFSTASVGFLVTQADGSQEYDPASSHIVFYLHNCLPLTRYLGSTSPAAGIADTQIRLKHRGEELDPNRVVYRVGNNYERGSSSPLGSGGVANVESGLWNAAATITQPDGSEHALQAAFQVPKGGVGVVHLFPSSP